MPAVGGKRPLYDISNKDVGTFHPDHSKTVCLVNVVSKNTNRYHSLIPVGDVFTVHHIVFVLFSFHSSFAFFNGKENNGAFQFFLI